VTHLVWDWNGTLLDDLALVVSATNAALTAVGGAPVTADEHRRDFRRPIADYYAHALGRPVLDDEFGKLDRIFHEVYQAGLREAGLAVGAREAMAAWTGSQSLLSMWFHRHLVPTVQWHGLTGSLARVDGLRATVGGGPKAPHLVEHLASLGVPGRDAVLIGDSIDDAEAAEAVGARVVLYTGGFTDEIRLRATGLPVATTLMEAVTLAAKVGNAPVPGAAVAGDGGSALVTSVE